MTTDLGRGQIQRLLDLPGGLHAFGIWNILWMLAARCTRRGVLADRGLPLTPQELAKAAKCSIPEIEQAVKLLRSPGVELLERVPLAQALALPEIPLERPRKTKQRFSMPFTHCPNCKVDLVAIVAEMSDCPHHHHPHENTHHQSTPPLETQTPDLAVGTTVGATEPARQDETASNSRTATNKSVMIELKKSDSPVNRDPLWRDYLAETIELDEQLQSGMLQSAQVEQAYRHSRQISLPLGDKDR